MALSLYPGVLEGFSLNRQTLFDSVIRAPVTVTIDRETPSAHVSFPELVPGINFMPDPRHPFFEFVIALGIIPDLLFTPNGYRPTHKKDVHEFAPAISFLPWLASAHTVAGSTVELKLTTPPPDNSFTLMVTVGIRYGAAADLNTIKQVKHAGSFKVLRVG